MRCEGGGKPPHSKRGRRGGWAGSTPTQSVHGFIWAGEKKLAARKSRPEMPLKVLVEPFLLAF
jgi:hypothetical protein